MVSNFANIKGAQSFKFVVKTIPGQKCARVKVAYFGHQMDLLGKLSTTKVTKLWTLSVSPFSPPSPPPHPSPDTHGGVFGKAQKDNYKNVSE